jgi:hypothetical protein
MGDLYRRAITAREKNPCVTSPSQLQPLQSQRWPLRCPLRPKSIRKAARSSRAASAGSPTPEPTTASDILRPARRVPRLGPLVARLAIAAKRLAAFFWCAEHDRQLGGESPPSSLMVAGEGLAKRKGVAARRRLRESKVAARWIRTGYQAYGFGRASR